MADQSTTTTIECDDCGGTLAHERHAHIQYADGYHTVGTYRHECDECDGGYVEIDRPGDGVSCAYAVRVLCDCQDDCCGEVAVFWSTGRQIAGGLDDA